jgi:hypothetical protein
VLILMLEASMMEVVVNALMSATDEEAWRQVGLFNPPGVLITHMFCQPQSY